MRTKTLRRSVVGLKKENANLIRHIQRNEQMIHMVLEESKRVRDERNEYKEKLEKFEKGTASGESNVSSEPTSEPEAKSDANESNGPGPSNEDQNNTEEA